MVFLFSPAVTLSMTLTMNKRAGTFASMCCKSLVRRNLVKNIILIVSITRETVLLCVMAKQVVSGDLLKATKPFSGEKAFPSSAVWPFKKRDVWAY